MILRAKFTTGQLKRVHRVFRKLEKAGRDPSDLLDAFGQTLVESGVHRLAVTNETPDGEPWAVSARARVEGGPTQYDTGRLAQSLTHQSSARDVVWGSALPYALQRQLGGTIRAKTAKGLKFSAYGDDGTMQDFVLRSVTQPARPYLGISKDDEDELEGLGLDFLAAIVEGEARP